MTLSANAERAGPAPALASRIGAGLALAGMILVWLVGLIPAALHVAGAAAFDGLARRWRR